MYLWCVIYGSKKEEDAEAPDDDDDDDDSHRPSPESSYMSTLSAQNPK